MDEATGAEVQTELTVKGISNMQNELNVLYEEMQVLKCQLQSFEVFIEVALQDDQRVQFYTGQLFSFIPATVRTLMLIKTQSVSSARLANKF